MMRPYAAAEYGYFWFMHPHAELPLVVHGPDSGTPSKALLDVYVWPPSGVVYFSVSRLPPVLPHSGWFMKLKADARNSTFCCSVMLKVLKTLRSVSV